MAVMALIYLNSIFLILQSDLKVIDEVLKELKGYLNRGVEKKASFDGPKTLLIAL